jgi:hypothetical protein
MVDIYGVTHCPKVKLYSSIKRMPAEAEPAAAASCDAAKLAGDIKAKAALSGDPAKLAGDIEAKAASAAAEPAAVASGAPASPARASRASLNDYYAVTWDGVSNATWASRCATDWR